MFVSLILCDLLDQPTFFTKFKYFKIYCNEKFKIANCKHVYLFYDMLSLY